MAAKVQPSASLPDQVGLHATKAIPPGSEITSIEKPLLAVVDLARLDETCSNCFKWIPDRAHATAVEQWLPDPRGVTLSKCLGCSTVKYCDKTCQAEAWKGHHKHECKLYNRLRPRVLPTIVRAMIRLLLLREKGALSDEEWLAFSKLRSHEADFRKAGGDRWDEISLTSKAAKHYSGTRLAEDAVRDLCCRIHINSHTLITPTFDSLGMCVDPVTSSVNHSCNPNAVLICDGRRIFIRSIHEIKADEEVRIGYVDCTDPYRRRQAMLQQRYFFSCRCVKCEQGPTLREDRFLHANIDGSRVHALEDQLFGMLQSATKDPSPTSANQRLREAVTAMKDSAIWPLERQPSPAIRQELATNYLSQAKWVEAFKHLLKIYLYIDPILYPESWHPSRVVHTWTLTTLMIHLVCLSQDEPDRVRELERFKIDYGAVLLGFVLDVVANVPKSHGPSGTFTAKVAKELADINLNFDLSGKGPSAADVESVHRQLEPEWPKLRAIADTVD